jgi:Transposase DDE domain
MVEKESVCLRRLGGDRASEVRFGRFLSNRKVTHQEIMREGCEKTGAVVEGLHVLALHDTSELNYEAHANRVRGLGTVGNGKDVGLFIHPLLVLDAQSGACLGLAHQHMWIRTQGAAENYAQLPIEEKESYRWLEVAQAGKEKLQRAAMVTIIADRESDIYQEWDRIPDRKTHLLTRACQDRMLSNGQKLYGWLESQAVQGCYRLSLPGRADKRSAHEARMEIRYGEVEIKRPKNCTDKKASARIKLNAIEVKERAESVVGEEKPIRWRLLTTHKIESVEQALECVRWYCARWQIEQFFRTLKKQGLQIESSQVEEGERLMKLVSIAMQVAVRTMQLTLAREGNTARFATDIFDENAIEVLEQLQPGLEGRTTKQKNPHEPKKLAWAAWIIARLGGWKGYASEAKPGPITMLRGQQRFAIICEGWNLAKMCA